MGLPPNEFETEVENGTFQFVDITPVSKATIDKRLLANNATIDILKELKKPTASNCRVNQLLKKIRGDIPEWKLVNEANFLIRIAAGAGKGVIAGEKSGINKKTIKRFTTDNQIMEMVDEFLDLDEIEPPEDQIDDIDDLQNQVNVEYLVSTLDNLDLDPLDN